MRGSRSLIVFALAAAVLPQAPVHAAGPVSLLWTGGANTWDTASLRWESVVPNDTIWNNTLDAGTIAGFNTASNVSIASAGITAGGLNFQTGSDGIHLNGTGTLTLTSGNVTVATGVTAAIDTLLATPAGLGLTGGGTLSVAGDFSSNVSLTGGTLSVGGMLDLGSGGTNSASVAGGAILHSQTLTLGETGGSGTVTLSGAGSMLAIDDAAFVGGNTGSAGIGNITLSGGAHVTSSGTTIACSAGSTGTVSMSGSGTVWAIGATASDELYIGSQGGAGLGGGGNGSLSILGGAQLTQDPGGGDPAIFISGPAAHPGAVTVSGSGSLLAAGFALNVGWTGPGHLDLSSGGAATVDGGSPAANTLVVGTSGSLGGAGTVNGDVVNNGFFSPGTWALTYGVSGEFASRAFTINGNFTQSGNGVISAKIDGIGASTNTRVVVSGTFSEAGNFLLTFDPSVNAAATFQMISAASIKGAFDTVSAAGLDSPFYTDFSNLSVNGTVRVVDPSTFWTNPAGGSWHTGSNWSTTSTPTPLQAPVFNSPGATLAVSFAADSSVLSVLFRNGNVTLDLGGHSLIATAPSTLDVTPVIAVGDFAGSSANVSLSNGSVNVTNGNLTVGSRGNGTLAIGAGATVNAGTILVGAEAGSSGQMSIVPGATVVSAGHTYVGYFGNGTVVQSGGSLSTSTLGVANNAASSGNYTLTGGTLSAGAEELAFDNGAVAVFTQSGGNHTVTGQLLLAAFDANSRATYYLSGTGILSVGSDLYVAESGSASMVQTGGSASVGGVLYLIPNNGETALYSLQSGGLATSGLTVGSGGALTQTGGSLSVATSLTLQGGTVTLGGSQTVYTFPKLYIMGGTLALTGAARSVVTSGMSFDGTTDAWNGLIDVGVGKLLVSDAVTHAATLANLRNQVAFARGHSNGITSSALPANMGLAVLDNAVLQRATFGGVSVDGSYVFVAPELLGDANADGRVDLTDLATVLNSFGTATPAWTSGNFEGGATIDSADISFVLNNFGASNSNALSAGVPVAAPEPATLALLVPVLFVRRRRRNA